MGTHKLNSIIIQLYYLEIVFLQNVVERIKQIRPHFHPRYTQNKIFQRRVLNVNGELQQHTVKKLY